MPVQTEKGLVSVHEYLSTAFHPDADYVDGYIEERNVGEKEHSKLQYRMQYLLNRHLVAFSEARLRTSQTRYKVPDVCAYEHEPEESVFTHPPLLCIEILSPEDRMSRVTVVLKDYLSMGVPDVWLLDPLTKKAYTATVFDSRLCLTEALDRVETHDGRITLPLEEVFSQERLRSL